MESQKTSWSRALFAAWRADDPCEGTPTGGKLSGTGDRGWGKSIANQRKCCRRKRQPGMSRGSPDLTVGRTGDDTGKIDQQTTRPKSNGVFLMRQTGPFPAELRAATRRRQSDARDGFEMTGGEENNGNHQPADRQLFQVG
ncbi:hypothetical protein T10_11353 [Trichinella papuae]|uniref:Uncharacterized protein n=1 Tax=Trichinella papuae TaxID=268474 RepID=A0A0V1MBY3_9BILA|nr:hypothetical protein T10_11353 [Trichinella papuae]